MNRATEWTVSTPETICGYPQSLLSLSHGWLITSHGATLIVGLLPLSDLYTTLPDPRNPLPLPGLSPNLEWEHAFWKLGCDIWSCLKCWPQVSAKTIKESIREPRKIFISKQNIDFEHDWAWWCRLTKSWAAIFFKKIAWKSRYSKILILSSWRIKNKNNKNGNIKIH